MECLKKPNIKRLNGEMEDPNQIPFILRKFFFSSHANFWSLNWIGNMPKCEATLNLETNIVSFRLDNARFDRLSKTKKYKKGWE